MGVEDWFPQRPHFLHLRQFLQFFRTALTSCENEFPHHRIQHLLVDTVGGAIGFSIPMISTAHIFHTTLAVPAADHRNERIPTFPAGQQSRIAVLGLIAVCGAGLLFEQALYLLPFLFSDDYGNESLMTIPVGFVYMLGFSVIILPAMVVQHTGVRFFHQNVLHAGICPQELPVTGFVRMPNLSAAPFSSELRRCLSPRSIKPPGNLFLPTTLQVKRMDELHRARRSISKAAH